MRLSEILEVINGIEKDFPVDKIEYQGVKVWPLLRLELVKKMKGINENTPKIEVKIFSGLQRKLNRTYDLLIQLTSGMMTGSRRRKSEKGDLFIIEGINHGSIKLEGKYFHRFYNSIVYFGPNDYNLIAVEKENYQQKSFERSWSPIFIGYDNTLAKIKGSLRSKLLNNTSNEIHLLKEFVVFIQDNFPFIKTDINYLKRSIYSVFNLSNSLEKIINQTKAETVYFICFYTKLKMAASLAAYNSNIRSVEIQHGQQGDNHPMYTHWPAIPIEGYEMIPKHFWMWGEKSADRIRAWTDKTNFHSVFVAGNPWMAYCLENRLPIEDREKDFLEFLKGKKKVLVSMQYPEIPDVVLKAMKKPSADHIYWLIRMHPKDADRIPDVEALLDRSNITGEWEIKFSSSVRYTELIKEMDIQITLWSTVAYEALVFNVPTILVHKNGKEAMKDYLGSNIFKYTDDPDTLISMIEKGNFAKEKTKYIDHDIGKIKAALGNTFTDS